MDESIVPTELSGFVTRDRLLQVIYWDLLSITKRGIYTSVLL